MTENITDNKTSIGTYFSIPSRKHRALKDAVYATAIRNAVLWYEVFPVTEAEHRALWASNLEWRRPFYVQSGYMKQLMRNVVLEGTNRDRTPVSR